MKHMYNEWRNDIIYIYDIIILSPVDGYKDCVVLISPLASLFVSEMKKYFLIKLWPPPRCEIVSVSWTCSLLDVLRRNPVWEVRD